MPEINKPPRRLSRRKMFLLLCLLILMGGAASFVWNKLAPTPPAQEIAESPPLDGDSRYRKLVIGKWEDEYQGKRTMTLNEDGTGTMVVELSGWRAALSASRLKFNMKWSIEDGRLKKQTLSGEPESQVKMILKTMGDRVDEPILELTPDRLLLLDADGKTKYDWRRVKE